MNADLHMADDSKRTDEGNLPCWFIESEYSEELLRPGPVTSSEQTIRTRRSRQRSRRKSETRHGPRAELHLVYVREPESGRIAVKVIDYLGNEVKMFRVE